MLDQFRCLFLFYRSPRRAASDVLDRGHFLFAVIAALLVTIALSTGATISEGVAIGTRMQQQESAADPMTSALAEQRATAALDRLYFGTSIKALLVMAVVFVPVSILILAAWDHLGGGMTILFRDYMSVLTGLLFAWTTAQLPFAVVWCLFGFKLIGLPAFGLQLAALILFGCFGSFVLSTVTGVGIAHACFAAVLSLVVCVLASFGFAASSGFLYMFASPWVLYYVYQMFGRDIRSLGGGLSVRQNFKRQLEAATLNPRDSDAHYQLGLVYVQRHNFEQAEASFRRAMEIQPDEADTLFQLGKLLSQQPERFTEALALLERAVRIDPRLENYEVWRELGSLALAAGRADVALPQLEHYVSFREYDPEGLVLLGQALRAAHREPEARVAFEKAIHAVKTAPHFRRHGLKRWESQARQELRQ